MTTASQHQSLPAATQDRHGTVTVHGHAAAVAVAQDPQTFSNAVSRHLQIPNGLDGAEHRRYRALIDRYFTPEAMADFAPACQAVAQRIAGQLPLGTVFDAVEDLGMRFAVEAQSAWLGWPVELADSLVTWVRENQAATRSGDPARTAQVARDFDRIIHSLIEPRRNSDGSADLTDQLIHDDAAGQLSDEYIVSILRNWTGGDLASIAQCTGVILHHLAHNPRISARIAQGVSDAEVDAMVEEFLRIEDPFVSNRRVATQDTHIAGCPVPSGTRVVINWADANRDPEVFADPYAFDPHGNAAANLVYGIGPHVCPGRPLARLELRELTRAVLAVGTPQPAGDSAREEAPMGGFRTVPVVLT
ncbi:cytochrome P450 [Kocuria sp.]|uniref:cytochrome P450 n=1 Tax=Kocuria sp. TaxID=1871328 RepID=UPI0026DED71F|nr:cytochrome P450 [Kocuria sp.]MDO5618116.1 cytochrome P450 [Kocuria sp.]